MLIDYSAIVVLKEKLLCVNIMMSCALLLQATLAHSLQAEWPDGAGAADWSSSKNSPFTADASEAVAAAFSHLEVKDGEGSLDDDGVVDPPSLGPVVRLPHGGPSALLSHAAKIIMNSKPDEDGTDTFYITGMQSGLRAPIILLSGCTLPVSFV